MMIDPLSRLLPTPMMLPPIMLVGLSEKDSDVGVDIVPLSPGPAPVFWAVPGAPGVPGGVPMGAKPADAEPLIRLLMLVNDISLRNLIPGELGKGFGFLQSKGQTATILVLGGFEGFRPSHAPASCSRRQPLSDEFFV